MTNEPSLQGKRIIIFLEWTTLFFSQLKMKISRESRESREKRIVSLAFAFRTATYERQQCMFSRDSRDSREQKTAWGENVFIMRFPWWWWRILRKKEVSRLKERCLDGIIKFWHRCWTRSGISDASALPRRQMMMRYKILRDSWWVIIDYLYFTKSRCWRNLSIVNYDTSYQDPLLARHSSNKFDSALATLRNCELSIVNCELPIALPAKGWMRNPYIRLFCFFSL